MLFAGSGSREETIVNFERKGCQSHGIHWVNVCSGACCSGPRAFCRLILEEFVTDELIIFGPWGTAVIDHGLGIVVMLVKVGVLGRITKLGVFVDVLDAVAGLGVRGSLVLLEAKSTCSGEGEVGVFARRLSYYAYTRNRRFYSGIRPRSRDHWK